MRIRPHVTVTAAGWLVFACFLAILAEAPVARPASSDGVVRGHVRCLVLRDCEGVIVYIERIAGRTFPPGPPVVMDQARLAFTPHILTVVTGTTVVFPNSDDVRHNVFSASKPKRFNLGTYPKGVARKMTFDTAGLVEVLCNVHPEMSAYIIIADTPYAAPVQSDGAFALNSVPSGTFDVVAWHERLKAQRHTVTLRDNESVTVNFDLR